MARIYKRRPGSGVNARGGKQKHIQPPHRPEGPVREIERRHDLSKQASAILKKSGFDAFTGVEKNKQFHRSKRARQKKASRRWRECTRKLGKLGPASPTRRIDPATREDNY